MADQNDKDVKRAQEQKQSTHIRRVLADAYTFVRSAEVNRAIATVTIEDLMADQIARNGETSDSNYAKYDPYIYDPDNPPPKGVEGARPSNFLSGTDTLRPPKIVYIQALKNKLAGVIKEVKSKDPIEIANSGEYVDEADTPGEIG